jgi:hypothetical protein
MAITKYTVGLNTADAGPNWTNVDLYYQMEKALGWLGWHGPSEQGLVAGVTTYIGLPNNLPDLEKYPVNTWEYFFDVKPIATTGIGTGASFRLDFYNREFKNIRVNRVGHGYTGGEILTLNGDDFGGLSNGQVNFQVKVHTEDTVDPGIAQTVSIAFTGQYHAGGTDRVGLVTGQAAAIHIQEGDTLKIYNNQDSNAYDLNIIGFGKTQGDTPSNDNYVWNVKNANASVGGTITWTPLVGQAGSYWVTDDSANTYSDLVPHIFVSPAPSTGIITATYGTDTQNWHDSLLTRTDTNNYGILKLVIDNTKYYGTVYRSFNFDASNNLNIGASAAYVPLNSEDYVNAETGPEYLPNTTFDDRTGHFVYGKRYAGERRLDVPYNVFTTQASFENQWSGYNQQNRDYSGTTSIKTGNDVGYQLDLNVYRSSIDPNFAVFSYKKPTVSTTSFSGSVHQEGTFLMHNYNSNAFDYDHEFLGGFTMIRPENSNNSTNPFIEFRTYLHGKIEYYSGWNGAYREPSMRTAEAGYSEWWGGRYLTEYVSDVYRTVQSDNSMGVSDIRVYNRDIREDNQRSKGYYDDSLLDSEISFNAVIKGMPMNSKLVPCPYYMPDDFALIDFRYNLGGVNIQQGDTVTISGSEVYEVIVASYNQATVTRGMLFCARIV